MIDSAEPLSLLIWMVFAFAVGLYPLGIMLPCSTCCGGEDGGCAGYVPFKKCARFSAVEQTPRPAAVSQTGTDGSPTEPIAIFGTFPIYTHGFSRSITRPEAIGAFRVPAFASAPETAVNINISDPAVSQYTVELQSLYGFGTPQHATVTLYTWTVILDNEAPQQITEVVDDTSSVVRVPRPENGGETLAVALQPPADVSPPDQYLRPWQSSQETWLRNTYVWSDVSRYAVMQPGGHAPAVVLDTSVSATTVRYIVKVSDFDRTGSQDWVVDKTQVEDFLAGRTSLRYIDHNDKEWDVEIGEAHPACGWPINVGAFAGVISSTISADVRVCNTSTKRLVLHGCLPRAPGAQSVPQVNYSTLGYAGWGRVGEFFSPYNRYIQARTLSFVSLFPYVKDGPSASYAGEPFGTQAQECIYQATTRSCSQAITRRIPSEAFYCGDVLWVMENGPCAQSLTLNYTDGATETYTLGDGGVADNGNWSVCILNRNGAVADYQPTWDGKCWPNSASVTFGVAVPRTNNDGSFVFDDSGAVVMDYLTSIYRCDGTLQRVGPYNCAALYDCVNGSWVALPNPISVELSLVSCGGASILNGAYGTFTYTCDGAVTYSKGNAGMLVWTQRTYPSGSPCAGYAGAMEFAPAYPISAALDGPFTLASQIGAITVTPDVLPQEGGTVTVSVTQDGVGTVSSEVEILPNPLRQQRTVIVNPTVLPRRAISGPPSSFVAFDYDTASIPVTQSGTGGEDDSQCRVDMNWTNATVVDARRSIVYADFVDEPCLVGLPAAVDGDTCEWSISTSDDWLKIDVNETTGLVKITIDPEKTPPAETQDGFHVRLGYDASGYNYYSALGLTASVTIGNSFGEVTWTLKIRTG